MVDFNNKYGHGFEAQHVIGNTNPAAELSRRIGAASCQDPETASHTYEDIANSTLLEDVVQGAGVNALKIAFEAADPSPFENPYE